MAIKLILTIVFSILPFFITTNAHAEYYNELQCYGRSCGCNNDGIIKLGMTLPQVMNRCGGYARQYPTREVHEKWKEWRYGSGVPAKTTATHEKYLFRNKKWKGKEYKILKFRNWKLYEIYDYGTLIRWPKLPKKFYK